MARRAFPTRSDEPYDVVVLDIMLPSLDGLSVVSKIREKKILTPVLLLSAKATIDDRVKGLRSGGDDYVTKPFSFVELLARVEALVRRSSRTAEPTSLAVADLSLDLQTRKVTRNGKAIDLQAREFSLLEYLDAQRRTRGDQEHDPESYLGLRLRAANECCRCPRLPFAEQDRQGF